jgi:outer membrane protein TolC
MPSRVTDGDHGRSFLPTGLAVPATLPTPAPAKPVTPAPETPLDLDGLVRLALETNPRVKRAALEVEAARGRAVQPARTTIGRPPAAVGAAPAARQIAGRGPRP